MPQTPALATFTFPTRRLAAFFRARRRRSAPSGCRALPFCAVFSTLQNGAATGQTTRVGDDGAIARARSFKFDRATAANCVESFFARSIALKQ